jgi:3-methyladenine DNA glycosylase Mpg
MARLNRNRFKRRSDTVAKNLLGSTIVCVSPERGETRMRLTEIGAYEGATKSTSEGASYLPGLVSISTKFGKYLLDISTGRSRQPSCITLRGGEIEIGKKLERICGPGKLTEALGITKDNKAYFQCASIYGSKIWIEGDPVDPSQVRKLRGNSSNCLGIYRC